MFASEDVRFIWNSSALQPLKEQRLRDEWFVNLVQGCFFQTASVKRNEKIELYLICRRKQAMGGNRLYARGLDEDGNCANTVECEQVVVRREQINVNLRKATVYSYVQLRGSVPLFWR